MISERIRTYLAARNANTSVMMGLLIIPLLVFVGGAVDFGRAELEKDRLQSVSDTARADRVGQLFGQDEAERHGRRRERHDCGARRYVAGTRQRTDPLR
ncbi:MAG: Tad domain-containing protein [Hyphomonas sp.]|nr:Tad domain-containing protein [Hyphomonas sp.]MCB9972584.1 Tad domain-containing protein [Hyphomonas sp.]